MREKEDRQNTKKEGDAMNNSERLKACIAAKIATEITKNFLLPEKAIPEHIDIHVSYQQSLAHLRIEAEKIKQIFCEEVGR